MIHLDKVSICKQFDDLNCNEINHTHDDLFTCNQLEKKCHFSFISTYFQFICFCNKFTLQVSITIPISMKDEM